MTGGNYYSVEVRNEPVAGSKPKKARRSSRSLWSRSGAGKADAE